MKRHEEPLVLMDSGQCVDLKPGEVKLQLFGHSTYELLTGHSAVCQSRANEIEAMSCGCRASLDKQMFRRISGVLLGNFWRGLPSLVSHPA